MTTNRINLSNLSPDIKEKIINGKTLISFALGSLGAFGLMAVRNDTETSDDKEIELEDIPEADFIEFGTHDIFGKAENNLSFEEAFSQQREALGPGGIFEHRNNYYNTFYREEWDSMSNEDRKDYYASVEQHIDYSKIKHVDEAGTNHDLTFDVAFDSNNSELLNQLIEENLDEVSFFMDMSEGKFDFSQEATEPEFTEFPPVPNFYELDDHFLADHDLIIDDSNNSVYYNEDEFIDNENVEIEEDDIWDTDELEIIEEEEDNIFMAEEEDILNDPSFDEYFDDISGNGDIPIDPAEFDI